MSRYLIEVPHDNRKQACDEAIRVFQMTGSHFLTNADWGCTDDIHRAWITVDLANKDEALLVVPPVYRSKAKVIKLEKFALETIKKSLKHHKA